MGTAPLRRTVEAHRAGAGVPAWWSPLHARAARGSIFTSEAWMHSWLEAYGDLFPGDWVRWEREGEVVAGCLLAHGSFRPRAGLRLRALFVNATAEASERTPLAEFNDVLCLPGEEAAVARDFASLLGELPWHCVFLSGYEAGGVLDAVEAQLPRTRSSREDRPAPYVDLGSLPQGAYEDVLAGNTRGQVRRSRRGYEERYGPVRLEPAGTPAERDRILDKLAELHNARWRERGIAGAFESARVMRFHRQLVARLAPHGGADLLRVTAGEADIGCLLNYVDRGKVCFFQSGFAYEPDARLKPGLLTHCLAIGHYRDAGAREYDFLAGEARYKRSLARQERRLSWTVVYRDSAWLRTLFRARALLGWLRGGTRALSWALPVLVAAAAARPAGAADAAAATVAQACAVAGAAEWKPVAGKVATPPPALPRPAKGQAVRDPVFGTCVVRATAHGQEPPKGFARADYSRRQAFNADGTRFLVVDDKGTWHLYDAATLRHLGPLRGPGGDAEPQWHPEDPDRLRHVPRNGVGMRLLEVDVRTGESRTLADFGERVRRLWPSATGAWTRSEGSPSADGRYWAFQVDDAEWKGLGLFTYDLREDAIIATYDLAAHGRGRPDHLSMSPTGRFVVVSWDDGPRVFDRDFTGERALAGRGEHSDIALDAAGEDVYVSVDYQASGGPVYMTHLRTGRRTVLFDSYVASTATALHFSGKAYRAPGWVVVSSYADHPGGGRLRRLLGGGGFQWPHRKVFAVELREHPRIVNLAFHHGQPAGYFTEPHATANRDLSRVLFNSNWGSDSKTDVDAYLVVLPRSLPAAAGPGAR